jgi:dipeptidyl aminopeptidase/acylaminoacyl peptidase
MRAFLPRWSPDREQIVFSASLPDSTWNLYLVSSEGGTPQRMLPSEQLQMDPNWSPDGNSLVFSSSVLNSSGVRNVQIFTIDLRPGRVSMLPGSTGLYSPHWSPDGRYVAAIKCCVLALMIFDFTSQQWTEAFPSQVGYETFSRDGKNIYFLNDPAPEFSYRVLRLRMSDRKVEEVVDLKNAGPLTNGTFATWFGLAPDDSPLVTRDISTQEIYALEMDWP